MKLLDQMSSNSQAILQSCVGLQRARIEGDLTQNDSYGFAFFPEETKTGSYFQCWEQNRLWISGGLREMAFHPFLGPEYAPAPQNGQVDTGIERFFPVCHEKCQIDFI